MYFDSRHIGFDAVTKLGYFLNCGCWNRSVIRLHLLDNHQDIILLLYKQVSLRVEGLEATYKVWPSAALYTGIIIQVQ